MYITPIHNTGIPFFCASYVQISHYTFIVLLVPQAHSMCKFHNASRISCPPHYSAHSDERSTHPLSHPNLRMNPYSFGQYSFLPFRFDFVKEQFYLNWRLTNNLNEKGNPVFLDSLNRWGLLFVPNRGGFIRRNNVEARFTVCSFGLADYLIYEGRRKTGSDENNFQVIAFLL